MLDTLYDPFYDPFVYEPVLGWFRSGSIKTSRRRTKTKDRTSGSDNKRNYNISSKNSNKNHRRQFQPKRKISSKRSRTQPSRNSTQTTRKARPREMRVFEHRPSRVKGVKKEVGRGRRSPMSWEEIKAWRARVATRFQTTPRPPSPTRKPFRSKIKPHHLQKRFYNNKYFVLFD